MTNKTKTNNINRIFGLIFIALGILFIYDSISDFFKYNFTTVLFVFMRSNSSIIAEFIFGNLLLISGILIFTHKKSWLSLIKILAIGIITNLVFALSFINYTFNWVLLTELSIRMIIVFGIYKLTEYLIRINQSEWNFRTQKLTFVIGVLIGITPFIFRNIYF